MEPLPSLDPLNQPDRIGANQPVGPSAFQQSEVRLKREDASTTGDYVRSMWRQDSVVDGLMAHIAGNEMTVDESYSPLNPGEWEELTKGVQEDLHPYLYNTHSPAHARYTRDLLLQKQEDLTRLGDMGLAGNVGRLALNVVNPENYILGMGAGYVAKGVKLTQVARAVKGADTVIGAAAAKAGVVAEQAAGRASGGALAAGIGFGAAENVAYEKLRQSVNFEDDNGLLLEAGLIGAAFTAPFALAGAKAERKISAMARKEHEVLKTMKAVENAQDLTPEQLRLFREVNSTHKAITEANAGRMSPEELQVELDRIRTEAADSDSAWMNKLQEDLRTQGDAILDELFPDRVGPKKPPKVYTPEERAAMDAAVEAETAKFHADRAPPKPPEAPEAPKAPDAPLENAMQLAMKRALAQKQAREAKAKPTDIEAAFAAHEAQTAAERHLTVEQAFERADAEAKASKLRDQERIINQRELADSVFKDVLEPDGPPTPKAPEAETVAVPEPETKAPESPTAAANDVVDGVGTPEAPKAPEAPVAPEAPKAPEVPVKDWTGEYVSWTHPKTGEEMDGLVKGINENGFFRVEDADGKTHVVHPNRIDQIVDANDVPDGFIKSGNMGAAQALQIIDPSAARSRMNVVGPKGVPLRWDIYAVLNRSQNEGMRRLVYDLVKDPLQNDDFVGQGMTASEWKSHYKRTVAGMFHREATEAATEARKIKGIPFWKAAQFNHEFHSLATRLSRGDVSVLLAHPNLKAQLTRVSTAQKKVTKHLLDEARKAGVKGVDEIPDNAFYVNRIWDHRGIQNAINKHGADKVHELLGRAINVPGYIGDAAKAARFLSIVRKLEFSPAMQNIHLYAKDMGTLRGALADAKLADDEINDIVDLMFQAKESSGSDAGRQANLKYRFDIEENLSMNTPAGVLRISDLLENDARVLTDLYANSMGGHIGLAKKYIDSHAAFNQRLEEIRNEMLLHPEMDHPQFVRELQLAQDMYNNITGKPMSTQDFSTTARIAGTFRGYTRSVSLGQLGIAAAFEMKQAIGLMGFRTFLQQSPTFSQFFRAIRRGYIPDVALARDVELMAGFGTEMASGYARAAEIEDGFYGQLMTRAEHGANVASHAVDIISGNASFTSITRQLTGMMTTQYFHDLASGVRKLTPEVRLRLVGQGLNDERIDVVFSQMKQYTTTGKNGRVETIDWEKWLEESPATYEEFQTALSRQTRDAIQDQDIGETMPFMHSTLGKMFGELKTFFLVAHAKNMLKNVSYMDNTAFQVWTIGFIGESLAYMVQTAANNANDPDKLREMLAPQQIATAAMFRSASLGMAPFVAETAYSLATGGDSLVKPGTTTNTDSRSFLNTPSLQVAKKLTNAPTTAAGLLLGTDTTTRQEGKDLYSLIPGSNAIGMRMLGTYLTNSLPASDPDKTGR